MAKSEKQTKKEQAAKAIIKLQMDVHHGRLAHEKLNGEIEAVNKAVSPYGFSPNEILQEALMNQEKYVKELEAQTGQSYSYSTTVKTGL